jgi:tetratricopeptide (TPR) repeat protein
LCTTSLIALAAKQLKDEGNEAFKKGQYDTAIELYTEALQYTDVDQNLYYSNRSAAHLAKGNTDAAVEDALKCIELKPKWSKVVYFFYAFSPN